MASRDICVELGQTIRELRRARGWRQIDLAAHAELSKTHISEVESGKRELGIRTLERLAEALGSKTSKILEAAGR